MKGFKKLLKDNVARVSLAISTFSVVASTATIAYINSKLPPVIPLLSSMPWGPQRLVDKNYLFMIPVFLTSFLIINIAISLYLYSRYTLLARILTFNNALISILAFLAYVQIMILVL